eukprot:scaffold6064_cov173-Amphora_coffeaeformis.AAC.9
MDGRVVRTYHTFVLPFRFIQDANVSRLENCEKDYPLVLFDDTDTRHGQIKDRKQLAELPRATRNLCALH